MSTTSESMLACTHFAVETFAENMPNYEKMTLVMKTLAGRDLDRHALRTEAASAQDKLASAEDLLDDELMLAPPNVHGFSLSDKEWRTSWRSPFICYCSILFYSRVFGGLGGTVHMEY